MQDNEQNADPMNTDPWAVEQEEIDKRLTLLKSETEQHRPQPENFRDSNPG